MTILTDGDAYFLPRSLRSFGGFHEATEWYLRGWKPLPYQWAWHHLTCTDGETVYDAPNSTFIGGIATGKTAIVAASYLVDAISIPHYSGLFTAMTQKQAELPFDMIMAWVEGNSRLEHLIENIVYRPWPIMTFKNFSQLESRTSGVDARFIRGSEYDRGNLDEAGLDPRGEIISVLRGRMRGVRVNGVARMGRLDVVSSPTGVPWMIERFKKGDPLEASYDPINYRSMRTTTWMNTKLTKSQIRAMEAEYPPDMIDVELGGQFPDYGVSRFPHVHISACVDQSIYDAAYIALYPDDGSKPKPGYQLVEDPRHGLIHFEIPPEPGRLYVVAGDPGTGSYPRRDAGCVIVADITEKPYKIVYFRWITGRGSYNPFLSAYRYAMDVYSPPMRGIDSTGTQKGITELAFENNGIQVDGLNFGQDKAAMLNYLGSDINNHLWRLPPIKGLISQLGNYTDDADKRGAPQDTVMTLAMLSFLVRFAPNRQEEKKKRGRSMKKKNRHGRGKDYRLGSYRRHK